MLLAIAFACGFASGVGSIVGLSVISVKWVKHSSSWSDDEYESFHDSIGDLDD